MIRRFARKPVGVAAAAWLLLVLVCAMFAPLIAPDDPQAQDLPAALSGPSGAHLLGADQLGRDVLSQLIYGARPALIGVVCAVATWLVLGVSLGITAGYLRGRADSAISRTADLLLSLPGLVVLLVVFSVFPGSLIVPMLVLGGLASAGLIRIVRSVTLTVREDLYVKAAQVLGLSRVRIMTRHVLPRVSSAVIVQAGLFAAIALVIQNGLSFLGFGVVLPNPSWGGVLGEASQVLLRSPWLLVPVGGVVGLTVLAFVLLGNATSDAWTEAWAPSQLSSTPPAGRGARAERAAGTAQAPHAAASDGVLSVRGLSVEFDWPAAGGIGRQLQHRQGRNAGRGRRDRLRQERDGAGRARPAAVRRAPDGWHGPARRHGPEARAPARNWPPSAAAGSGTSPRTRWSAWTRTSPSARRSPRRSAGIPGPPGRRCRGRPSETAWSDFSAR